MIGKHPRHLCLRLQLERVDHSKLGAEQSSTETLHAEQKAADMDARLANLGAEVEALRKSAREEAAPDCQAGNDPTIRNRES